ncbi:MAG: Tad domain-containing protein [Acidimicrobiales bacterium]
MRDARDGGYVIALAALLLLPLMAFTGLAVDLGGWYARAAAIQRTTDAASLAGVSALPRGVDAATTAATQVARQNGFVHGVDNIEISVTRVGEDRVRVEITDNDVPQYFTSLFRSNVTVARASVAEYVPPVRMGSPRNFLGTQRLTSAQSGLPAGAVREEFFLSINSPCSLNEDGDLLSSRWAGAGGTSNYCSQATASTVANPTYNPDGYIYGLRVEEGYSAGPVTIEVFDAAHCPAGNPPPAGYYDSPRLGNSLFTTTFRVLGPAPNPYEGPQLARRDVGGSAALTNNTGDCAQVTGPNSGGWRNGWRALHTFTPVPGQVYGIQVYSNSPSNNNRGNLNNFSLRARAGGSFQACSADEYEADPTLRQAATGISPVNCPNLFAMEHLSIFANSASSTAQFYLASIGPEHSNKTLVIDLFDPGEGGSELRLVNPLGQYVTFRRSVEPRYPSEVAPAGGWGPVTESVTDISATGPQPGEGRISAFRFNDRQLRLEYDLPDIAAAYGGATWWKIEYRFGTGTVTDRTTWSVSVRGDPVRLVE